MRDEHDGAGVLGEKRFEPFDRLDVEMVGRLVEQQQLGLRDQRARQQRPPAPAARQRRHRRFGGKVQPREHQLDALLDRPAVLLFQIVLQPAEPVQRRRRRVLGHHRRRVVVFEDQLAQVAQAIRDDLKHGARRPLNTRRPRPGFLCESRCPEVWRAPDGAGVGNQLARQHPQERRLAGAVAADHGDALTGLDAHRRVVEPVIGMSPVVPNG